MSRCRHNYVSKFRKLPEPGEDSKSEDGSTSKKWSSSGSTNQGELTVYSLLLSHILRCVAVVHVYVCQYSSVYSSLSVGPQLLSCRDPMYLSTQLCIHVHILCITHTIYVDYTFTYTYVPIILYVCMYVCTYVCTYACTHVLTHTLPYMQYLSLSLSWGLTPLTLRPQANPLGQECVWTPPAPLVSHTRVVTLSTHLFLHGRDRYSVGCCPVFPN